MRLRRLLSTLRLRLRSVFRRARVEQELDDEIRDHIDRRVAADVARGVPREQARQAALRAFGGIEQSKEACRDVRRVNVIEHTVQDLRFAARHFARAPVATATMIGIFALGIGFSTALSLFVQSFVSGPVPGIPRQESLVRIRGIDRDPAGSLRSAANSRIPNIGSTRRSGRCSATSPRGRRPISSSTSARARRTRRAAPRPTSPATISRCWVFARHSARASRSTRTTPIPRRRSSP